MIVDAQDSVVDDLMCVAVDNNPSKGSFFTDPGAGSVSLLDAATGVYSFKQPARSAVVSTTGFYEVGDNVGVRGTSSCAWRGVNLTPGCDVPAGRLQRRQAGL